MFIYYIFLLLTTVRSQSSEIQISSNDDRTFTSYDMAILLGDSDLCNKNEKSNSSLSRKYEETVFNMKHYISLNLNYKILKLYIRKLQQNNNNNSNQTAIRILNIYSGKVKNILEYISMNSNKMCVIENKIKTSKYIYKVHKTFNKNTLNKLINECRYFKTTDRFVNFVLR